MSQSETARKLEVLYNSMKSCQHDDDCGFGGPCSKHWPEFRQLKDEAAKAVMVYIRAQHTNDCANQERR